MDFGAALAAHADWKIRLRTAIMKCEAVDAVSIAKDNCCDLGRWLHGEARARYDASAAYRNLVARHAAFHTEAGRVAAEINAKRFDAASRMLEAGAPYAAASSAVGVAIGQFRREVEKAAA